MRRHARVTSRLAEVEEDARVFDTHVDQGSIEHLMGKPQHRCIMLLFDADEILPPTATTNDY